MQINLTISLIQKSEIQDALSIPIIFGAVFLVISCVSTYKSRSYKIWVGTNN